MWQRLESSVARALADNMISPPPISGAEDTSDLPIAAKVESRSSAITPRPSIRCLAVKGASSSHAGEKSKIKKWVLSELPDFEEN